jgi:hypothetical protein
MLETDWMTSSGKWLEVTRQAKEKDIEDYWSDMSKDR